MNAIEAAIVLEEARMKVVSIILSLVVCFEVAQASQEREQYGNSREIVVRPGASFTVVELDPDSVGEQYFEAIGLRGVVSRAKAALGVKKFYRPSDDEGIFEEAWEELTSQIECNIPVEGLPLPDRLAGEIYVYLSKLDVRKRNKQLSSSGLSIDVCLCRLWEQIVAFDKTHNLNIEQLVNDRLTEGRRQEEAVPVVDCKS